MAVDALVEEFIDKLDERSDKSYIIDKLVNGSDGSIEYKGKTEPLTDNGEVDSFQDKSESKFKVTVTDRKVINLDTPETEVTLVEFEGSDCQIVKSNPDSTKMSEGCLWHVRLSLASLDYLRKLQKVDDSLEGVTFDDSNKRM